MAGVPDLGWGIDLKEEAQLQIARVSTFAQSRKNEFRADGRTSIWKVGLLPLVTSSLF